MPACRLMQPLLIKGDSSRSFCRENEDFQAFVIQSSSCLGEREAPLQSFDYIMMMYNSGRALSPHSEKIHSRSGWFAAVCTFSSGLCMMRETGNSKLPQDVRLNSGQCDKMMEGWVVWNSQQLFKQGLNWRKSLISHLPESTSYVNPDFKPLM